MVVRRLMLLTAVTLAPFFASCPNEMATGDAGRAGGTAPSGGSGGVVGGGMAGGGAAGGLAGGTTSGGASGGDMTSGGTVGGGNVSGGSSGGPTSGGTAGGRVGGGLAGGTTGGGSAGGRVGGGLAGGTTGGGAAGGRAGGMTGGGPAGIEQRCRELVNDGNLATECFCSETLNYSQTRQRGVVNPPTASSFECAPQYGGALIDSNAFFSSVSGSTVGLSSVAWVIQIEKDTGGLTDFHGANINLSSKTLCERAYFRYSPGHRPPPSLTPGGNNAFKGPRWQNDANGAANSVDFHCSWAGGPAAPGPRNMHCVLNGATGSKWEQVNAGAQIPLVSGVDVVLDDCEASWCRFEACMDHNTRSGSHGVAQFARIGVLLDWPCKRSDGRHLPLSSHGQLALVDHFRDGCTPNAPGVGTNSAIRAFASPACSKD